MLASNSVMQLPLRPCGQAKATSFSHELLVTNDPRSNDGGTTLMSDGGEFD